MYGELPHMGGSSCGNAEEIDSRGNLIEGYRPGFEILFDGDRVGFEVTTSGVV